VFNLLPGTGLGFGGGGLLGFGLVPVIVLGSLPLPSKPSAYGGGRVSRGIQIYDNAYTKLEDEEMLELLSIIFEVIICPTHQTMNFLQEKII